MKTNKKIDAEMFLHFRAIFFLFNIEKNLCLLAQHAVFCVKCELSLMHSVQW